MPLHAETTESRSPALAARRSGAGSEDSTIAPSPRRWSRSGSSGASRRSRSHFVVATARSGSSTMRPAGSEAPPMSARESGRADVPASDASEPGVPRARRRGRIPRARPRARRAAEAAARGPPFPRKSPPRARAGTARGRASRRRRRGGVIPRRSRSGAGAPTGARRCGRPLRPGRARSSATR